uniref:Uncharacterized protein n=1 Tax=Sphaerodactylus townsendi TaxID=933632 RepID=A0ACB8EPN9_9SAUR
MAHRLRFHFGSGRSNTAPESEILDREREDDDFFMAFHTLPRRNGPHSVSRRRMDYSDGGGDLREVGALKRSTSMFIPQLLNNIDARPTRSSSMQISLQRKGVNGHADECGAPESPEEMCKLSDFGEDCASPVESHSSAISPQVTPENSPPRQPEIPGPEVNGGSSNHRIFCTIPSNSWNDSNTATAQDDAANKSISGLNISGVRIQHRASSVDVPQVTLMPFGSDSPNNAAASEPRRWSLQHLPDGSGTSGKKLLVFQLQQPHLNSPGAGADCNFGFTGTKGDRLVRYPRIRLERSTSYPVQPQSERVSPLGDGMNTAVPGNASEISRSNSVERVSPGQGCTFKIRPDQNSRQQHFRILVTRRTNEKNQASGQENSSVPDPVATNSSGHLYGLLAHDTIHWWKMSSQEHLRLVEGT